MTNKQKELINLCGYKIVDNRSIGEKECISSIYYDEKTSLFSIDMKSYNFTPGDYETIEMLSIALNRMLGLVYELNMIGEKNE